MGIAERVVPGTRAVAVHDVRLLKWIEAMPAVDVPVEVRQLAADRVEVSLTGYSRAVVELAAAHPAPPEPWPVDTSVERVPELTARQLYDERWMFHGPRFQGVSELSAVGDRWVRGVLTTPSAPGALLDNVGQLLGYWIMATLTERTTVFPVRMEHIRFHGPHPRPGERLTCLIRITEVTDLTLTADMQLIGQGGAVWAEFTGWQDRRFDTDANIRAVDRFPGDNTLSTERPGGWTMVHERWPDLATRELIMRNMLGSAERARYDELPPVHRRQWLLGRIAAKDAVRGLLWREGAGEIYPAEIAVRNDRTGRPLAEGVHGRELGELTVSIAHRRETGWPSRRAEPAASTSRRSPNGRAPRSRPRATPANSPCSTAWWRGHRAAARCGSPGSGPRRKPSPRRAARVCGAARRSSGWCPPTRRVRVMAGGRLYEVRVEQTANPPGLPDRQYVVAWTTTEHNETDQTGDPT